jgi:hypothetical protein
MTTHNSMHNSNNNIATMNSNSSSDNLERISIFRMTEFLPKKNRPIGKNNFIIIIIKQLLY